MYPPVRVGTPPYFCFGVSLSNILFSPEIETEMKISRRRFMVKFFRLTTATLVLVILSAGGGAQAADYGDVPFDMPKLVEPTFPDRDFNIIDYGAKSGGEFKNTEAFKKAIAACFRQSGFMKDRGLSCFIAVLGIAAEVLFYQK